MIYMDRINPVSILGSVTNLSTQLSLWGTEHYNFLLIPSLEQQKAGFEAEAREARSALLRDLRSLDTAVSDFRSESGNGRETAFSLKKLFEEATTDCNRLYGAVQQSESAARQYAAAVESPKRLKTVESVILKSANTLVNHLGLSDTNYALVTGSYLERGVMDEAHITRLVRTGRYVLRAHPDSPTRVNK